jgi:hypothetical protein
MYKKSQQISGDPARESPKGPTRSKHLNFFHSRRKSLGQFLFSRRGGFWGRVRELRAWTEDYHRDGKRNGRICNGWRLGLQPVGHLGLCKGLD